MSLNSAASRSRHGGHAGFSLIEMMVGVVIGLIAVLVIYQVFAAAEGIKRNTTSVGDAQQNGLLSSFMLTMELANASNGIATASRDLATCPTTASMATSFRPIPVLIIDGGAGVSDQFVVNYSLSSSVVAPVPFTAGAAASSDFLVQSPTGFKTGDLVLAISEAGACAPTKVNSVSAPDAATGVVTITHAGGTPAMPSSAYLMNLGPAGNAQRVLYDVSSNILRSSALWDANGAPAAPLIPNPLASNIVIMKLQYGIDSGAGAAQDGLLDIWVNPTAGPDGDWTAASVLAAPTNGSATVTTLNRIMAVRVGLVVQGEQFDKDLALSAPTPTWTLFADNAATGGPLTGALTPGFRYRTYETIVPLRNTIWNFKGS
jgi:type IV pilus assembly protein PilW